MLHSPGVCIVALQGLKRGVPVNLAGRWCNIPFLLKGAVGQLQSSFEGRPRTQSLILLHMLQI